MHRDEWQAGPKGISVATRTAIQERIKARALKGGGRSPSGGTRTYPLSGLLTCSVCGGGFQVYGSKKGPNGERWVQYHCATHKQKGDAACSNAVSVSEQSLLTAIQEALSGLIASPTFERAYLAALTKALQARPTGSDEEKIAAEAVRTQEEAVARLVDAVATGRHLSRPRVAPQGRGGRAGRPPEEASQAPCPRRRRAPRHRS